jgi:hypothetical protein
MDMDIKKKKAFCQVDITGITGAYRQIYKRNLCLYRGYLQPMDKKREAIVKSR